MTHDTTITLTDSARDTIRDIHEHVVHVQQVWGKHRPEWAVDTAVSATKALADLAQWGELEVSRDGELALFGKAPSMVFGVIPWRVHTVDRAPDDHPSASARHTVRMGLYCFTRLDDDRVCTAPVHGEPSCTGHEPMILAAPVPVTWSFHS